MADFYMLNQRFLEEIKAIDTQDPEYVEKVKALNAKYENLKSQNPEPEPVKYDPFEDIDKTLNESIDKTFDLFKSFHDRDNNQSGYMKYESSVAYIDEYGQRQETRVSKSRKLIDGKDIEVKESMRRYEDDNYVITETIDRNGKKTVNKKNKKPVIDQYLYIEPFSHWRTQLWRRLMFPALLGSY